MHNQYKVLLEVYECILLEGKRTKDFSTLPDSAPYGFVVWPDGSFASTGNYGHSLTASQNDNNDPDALIKCLTFGGARIVSLGGKYVYEQYKITPTAKKACKDLASFYGWGLELDTNSQQLYAPQVQEYMARVRPEKKKEQEVGVWRQAELLQNLKNFHQLVGDQKMGVVRRVYLILKVADDIKSVLKELSKTVRNNPDVKPDVAIDSFINLYTSVINMIKKESPDMLPALAKASKELADERRGLSQ